MKGIVSGALIFAVFLESEALWVQWFKWYDGFVPSPANAESKGKGVHKPLCV
jgi:hypothetical protein